ncbi:hypothetical protein Bbelb_319090 [Branchiostoma belcheri]|nr:hypothetical protein Bbelb_319090 [Branchiostoma belcheri]
MIGRRTGITVLRYDFSDPQAGKNICDRKIATMKSHIRRYVNEKHNVSTAKEMKEALESHGGVKVCRIAVAQMAPGGEHSGSGEGAKSLFYCPKSGCVATFESTSELDKHLDVGKHSKELERESTYDRIRKQWAQAITGIAHGQLVHSRLEKNLTSQEPP